MSTITCSFKLFWESIGKKIRKTQTIDLRVKWVILFWERTNFLFILYSLDIIFESIYKILYRMIVSCLPSLFIWMLSQTKWASHWNQKKRPFAILMISISIVLSQFHSFYYCYQHFHIFSVIVKHNKMFSNFAKTGSL